MLKRLLRHPRTQAALAWLLGIYLAFAYRTTRWQVVGAEHATAHIAGAPTIITFWHERLPLMPMLWRLVRQLPEQRVAHKQVHVLVSHHRDGQFIGAVIRRFQLDTILGSSSRGGAAGGRAVMDRLAAGDFITITPDGPRGPRRKAATGVVRLAAMSGVPVLPCAARTTRCLELKTWDRMLVPLPFARGVVCCVPPIAVAAEGWEDALPAVEAALTEAADMADRLCGQRRARAS